MKNVVAVILAGGKGSRLEPLTRDRAKPAVPFGGCWRIIDFTLSNCLNSGLRRLLVLTQYKSLSLDRHIDLAWRGYFQRELGEALEIVPPQQRVNEQWYQGTADAVWQNIYAIEQHRPRYVVILAGDHIYKMNIARLVESHVEKDADVTIAALPVAREAARQFGVMSIDADGRIVAFDEKPDDPAAMPGDPGNSLASMGIYVFTTTVLLETLCRDANLATSSHDFGREVIPSMIDSHRVVAWPFRDENRKQTPYWRDVGTLDAYYESNMDLVSVDPMLNLYDQEWPIRTHQINAPPPKFVFGSRDDGPRVGTALDSIVCAGTIISGARVRRSVIGPLVRIAEESSVDDSVVFGGASIGRNAIVRRAIIDKYVHVPDGLQIGLDEQADRARGFTVTPDGVTVIAKGDRIGPNSRGPAFSRRPAAKTQVDSKARRR